MAQRPGHGALSTASPTPRRSRRSILLAKLEGILPALESAHALAWVLREGHKLGRDTMVLVNLSGRGDKDVAEVLRVTGR